MVSILSLTVGSEMAARVADVQQRTVMFGSWWKSFAWLFFYRDITTQELR